MKPQDIVVLLKILVREGKPWRQLDLAQELGLSQTEVNFALKRLARSRLFDELHKQPMKQALTEFLIHGLKYIYPAELGAIGRGTVTAHSFETIASKVVSGEEHKVVWPDPEGKDRGMLLEPLYTSVPFAARQDPALHEWLAIIDAIRIGSVRVRKVAIDKITKKLGTLA